MPGRWISGRIVLALAGAAERALGSVRSVASSRATIRGMPCDELLGTPGAGVPGYLGKLAAPVDRIPAS